ncbi:MAG: ArnT family glycosyltransferase [Microgenomates group bacterium]
MKFFKKTKKIELVLVFLILLLASFLRFYRIADYMIFLGDEGRDVLIVKRMIVDRKFTLLGPIASIAPFHLGPFYYYLMVPFLWLFNLNPVGPAVMVALFGVATVFLIYLVGRDFFNYKVGLLASFFYAISPLVIVHSRSSWNPNVVPFFSLLVIYFVKKAEEKKDSWWWLGIIGFLLGINLQLHYICVFLIAIVGIYFLIFMPQRKKVIFYFYLWGGFILGWLPFLAFEVRHSFVNIKNLYWFLGSGQKIGVGGSFWGIVKDVFVRSFNDLVVAKSPVLLKMLIFSFVFLIWEIAKDRKNFKTYTLLLLWFFGGIFLFGFFKGTIYTYYLVFMFPAPFLIVGLILEKISKIKKVGWIIASLMFLVLAWANIKSTPLKQTPNYQLKQTQKIARFILEKTAGEPFNLGLISDRNTDFAYRYFLEIWGKPAKVIEPPQADPERKTVTSQLFVICEKKDCQPIGHPLWEIAGFGMAKKEAEWEVEGIKVYKLIHLES